MTPTPPLPTTGPAPAAAAAPAPVAPAGPRAGRRLRPGVAVTPLRAGLHLRGRRGSVTLEGSAALPVLWRSLEGPLRDGRLEELLAALEPGSGVRAAVETLVGQLEAHGLLAEEPAGPGPVARWVAESAERPGAAAAALAGTRAEVVAAAPDGPLARAAGRALALALPLGAAAVTHTADPGLPDGRILLTARGAGPERAVAAGLSGGSGYVTAPGSAAQVRSDAEALETRPASPGPAAATASVALLAGAAAHRLLCAAAGLADPAGEGGDERLLPGLPAVLLADTGPLRADYRTWLGPLRLDADRRADLGPAATLAEALRRVTALGDERCGVLPLPLPEDLRQLPVPLAALAGPGAPAAGAPRLDLARLELFCRTAELHLGGAGFTVGANPAHARGRALRTAAARHRAQGPAAGTAVPAADWSGHPQVRHWWRTLTLRLAVPARLEVHRAAPDREAYHAVVRCTADGRPLGEAVEATPGDAAAFAALAAVAAASGAPGRTPPSGGAAAPLAAAGARTAVWEDDGWTGRWLAGLAAREEALQDALRALAGEPRPVRAPAPTDPELLDLLRAFGFTVLHAPEEAR
ncbi:hypothetical protein OOK31_26455 [Streptomyces sp. NBC_00249]|uniref:hypothetical protein n=1 Tax=Streptomyces sp. NBC_00249 TaxID=2975690 RepID=UPI002250A15D|nr:hypothetical protein [Streptomyces sp. NBC_00249]MCX5197394.1 hypothetical protein [Streptomyces sp. NBC_00249]